LGKGGATVIGSSGATAPEFLINPPSYLDELDKIVETLPKSLGAIQAELRKKGEDPLPFTFNLVDNKTVVFLPHELPQDASPNVKQSVALIISSAQKAGFVITSTSKLLSKSSLNILEALAPGIQGFYYSLQRSHLTPVENIPKSNLLGWEYAQWYAYVGLTNDTHGGDYLRFRRVTSLLPESSAWTKGEAASDNLRLASLLQHIARNTQMLKTETRRILKSEEYFVTMYAGKKPISGIYTDEEFRRLNENWAARKARIETVYTMLPKFIKDVVGANTNKVSHILSEFNIENPIEIKKIAEYANKRITYLLVPAPRIKGKKESGKVIAKGQSLRDKVIEIGGDLGVRTIAKVMWSTLYEKTTTMNEFADMGVLEARSKLVDKQSWIAQQIAQWSKAEDSAQRSQMLKKLDDIRPVISSLADIYMEVYPDNVGKAPWDAAFAAPPKK
jgi:hypothetical protein